MLTWLKAILWDQQAARAALLGAIAFASVYAAQPQGRSEWERAAIAAGITFGVGGAAVSGPKREQS